MGNMLHGDLGSSLIRQGVEVSELIIARLPNTLLLMVVSTIIAMVMSIPFGIWSASKPNTPLDYSVTFVSFLGIATPNFWIALPFLLFFPAQSPWSPTARAPTLQSSSSTRAAPPPLLLP